MSLKELLCIIALLAVGISGITVGPPISWLSLTVFAALYLILVINSLLATGPLRAFSIGFLVPAIAYFAVIASSGMADAMQPNHWPQLPTTHFIQLSMRPSYTNYQDKEMREAREYAAQSVMPLGHLLFGLIFGLCGGYYGKWVYLKSYAKSKKSSRINEPPSPD